MPGSATPATRLSLGATIPLTLAVTFLAGLALQWMPLEKLAFRSQEALHNLDRGTGPFLPGKTYRNQHSYGDLAHLGNFPSLRQYRLETFTTDRWGYRNLPPALHDPAAILMGDSFGVALGVEDSQTLPAQLGRLWGRSVYNASGVRDVPDAAQIRPIAHRLGLRSGLVIYEFLERHDVPTIASAVPRAAAGARKAPETLREEIARRAREFWTTFRLRILAERAYRRVQNDRILPNPYRSGVIYGRLVNGREILFVPSDRKAREQRRPVSAEYWVRLREELGKAGLGLVVLLVPNKYTVYGPLLSQPVSPADPGVDYLSRLEQELRGRGIDVVNLEPVFQSRAREEMESGSYLYWLDDTHWTPRGIEVAAETLVRAIPDPVSSWGPAR